MNSPTAAREEGGRRTEAMTRIVVRPIAGPLSIGFLGLAAGTSVVAGMNLGWIEAGEAGAAALSVIAFTVPLQFLASVMGFLARDAVAATGMGLLSGIWLAQGLVLLASPPGSTSGALGLFLIVAMLSMWIPALAASRAKLVPAAVLFTAGLRFGVTGVFQLTGSAAWEEAAGIIGVGLAALALYAALAAEMEDALKRTVLPMGRRDQGRKALAGSLREQLADVHHEP
ncbi:MAG: GPR1/FUN34/YaaH family transporter, partial [Thermoleophilia bacterium]|nr:GPR1/FUN34/YaaH family transporter [Thermoleophilia bacterium]